MEEGEAAGDVCLEGNHLRVRHPIPLDVGAAGAIYRMRGREGPEANAGRDGEVVAECVSGVCNGCADERALNGPSMWTSSAYPLLWDAVSGPRRRKAALLSSKNLSIELPEALSMALGAVPSGAAERRMWRALVSPRAKFTGLSPL